MMLNVANNSRNHGYSVDIQRSRFAQMDRLRFSDSMTC